jgi:hypothetical protein
MEVKRVFPGPLYRPLTRPFVSTDCASNAYLTEKSLDISDKIVRARSALESDAELKADERVFTIDVAGKISVTDDRRSVVYKSCATTDGPTVRVIVELGHRRACKSRVGVNNIGVIFTCTRILTRTYPFRI